jgi:uncharacterized membrane protein YphA (DoxX/SURF4 family)
MPLPLIALHLFVRLLLGLLLFSVGVSKLAHPAHFRHGIQDYRLISPALDSRLSLSTLLAYSFPVAEIVVGLALITDFLLLPATILAIFLMVIFSVAMGMNLVRGRTDLSCHCSGAIGDHRLSWWLVGRNSVLIVGFFFLLVTPADMFTVVKLSRSPSAVSATLWMNAALPVVLLVGMILVALVLFNAARTLIGSR